MFTVFKEAIINLDRKLKQEMEQSASIANMLEGSWEPSLKRLYVIAGHCVHQLNTDGHKSLMALCSLHCHSLIGTVRIVHLNQWNPYH